MAPIKKHYLVAVVVLIGMLVAPMLITQQTSLEQTSPTDASFTSKQLEQQATETGEGTNPWKYTGEEPNLGEDKLEILGGENIDHKTKIIAILTRGQIDEETAIFTESINGGAFTPIQDFAETYYNPTTGERGYMIDIDPSEYTPSETMTYKFTYQYVNEQTPNEITTTGIIQDPIEDPLAKVPEGTTCSCEGLTLKIAGNSPVGGAPLGAQPPVGTTRHPQDPRPKKVGFGFAWEGKTRNIPLPSDVSKGGPCTEKQEIQTTFYIDGSILDSVAVTPNWKLGQPIPQVPRTGGVPGAGTAPFGGNTYRYDDYSIPQKDFKTHEPNGDVATNDYPGFMLFPNMNHALYMFKAKMTIDGGPGGSSCQKCVKVVQEFKGGKITKQEAKEAAC